MLDDETYLELYQTESAETREKGTVAHVNDAVRSFFSLILPVML